MQALEDSEKTAVHLGLSHCGGWLLRLASKPSGETNRAASPMRTANAFAPAFRAVLIARVVADPLPMSTQFEYTVSSPSGAISTSAIVPSEPVPYAWFAKAKPTP